MREKHYSPRSVEHYALLKHPHSLSHLNHHHHKPFCCVSYESLESLCFLCFLHLKENKKEIEKVGNIIEEEISPSSCDDDGDDSGAEESLLQFSSFLFLLLTRNLLCE
jgi:hypothetical protein